MILVSVHVRLCVNLDITFEPLGIEIYISECMSCEKSFTNTSFPEI